MPNEKSINQIADLENQEFTIIPLPKDKREEERFSEEKKTVSLGNLQALRKIFSFSFPFIVSRFAVSVNVLSNGFIISEIGSSAAAAGPVMISVVYAIIGPGRSILLSTGILVGKKYGELRALVASGNPEEIQDAQEQIGTQLRQSTLMGMLLGIPSIALLLGIGPILRSSGMDETIVKQVEGFLSTTATGILPIYWSTSDQQFAMATGHKNVPLFFGSLFPALSMLIGYPLALGTFGLPKLGTAGLGTGMSAAAWLSFIALRLYFQKSEFKPYQIYKFKLEGIFSQFADLVKLGLPLGFQALTEWGNLSLLSSLIARSGREASIASNGSFQIITAVSLIIAALCQGISIKISKKLGKMKIDEEQQHRKDLITCNQNIKRIGNAGILTGILLTTATAALLMSIPRKIQSVFLNRDEANYGEEMDIAETMLRTNALGLIAESVRNTSAGALAGSKDVWFAPVISFITMTLFSLTIGELLTENSEKDANWLFITRNIGIILAVFAIGLRWFNKDHTSLVQEPQNTSTETSSARSKCMRKLACFFKESGTKEERQPLVIGRNALLA